MNRFLAILAGFVSASIVMVIIETIGHQLYPPPANINDPEVMKAFVANMPLWAFLFIILAYFVGSIVGGLVTSLIAKENQFMATMILGAILTVLGIINLLMIAHPIWFTIVCLATFFAGTYLGYQLYLKFKKHD